MGCQQGQRPQFGSWRLRLALRVACIVSPGHHRNDYSPWAPRHQPTRLQHTIHSTTNQLCYAAAMLASAAASHTQHRTGDTGAARRRPLITSEANGVTAHTWRWLELHAQPCTSYKQPRLPRRIDAVTSPPPSNKPVQAAKRKLNAAAAATRPAQPPPTSAL